VAVALCRRLTAYPLTELNGGQRVACPPQPFRKKKIRGEPNNCSSGQLHLLLVPLMSKSGTGTRVCLIGRFNLDEIWWLRFCWCLAHDDGAVNKREYTV
jgi:hypothetical protein